MLFRPRLAKRVENLESLVEETKLDAMKLAIEQRELGQRVAIEQRDLGLRVFHLGRQFAFEREESESFEERFEERHPLPPLVERVDVLARRLEECERVLMTNFGITVNERNER